MRIISQFNEKTADYMVGLYKMNISCFPELFLKK